MQRPYFVLGHPCVHKIFNIIPHATTTASLTNGPGICSWTCVHQFLYSSSNCGAMRHKITCGKGETCTRLDSSPTLVQMHSFSLENRLNDKARGLLHLHSCLFLGQPWSCDACNHLASHLTCKSCRCRSIRAQQTKCLFEHFHLCTDLVLVDIWYPYHHRFAIVTCNL